MGSIRVLPTMVAFRYRYTCRRCGCHTISHFPISGGWGGGEYLVICAWCRYVYPGQSRWRSRRPSTVDEWETRRAMGWGGSEE